MEGCKMVKPYLNQVGGKVENDVNLFTGGLNTYVDKGFLEADQLPYVMNMTMWRPPMMCTRPSRITIANDMAGKVWASNIGNIVDMWAFDEDQFFVITKEESAASLKVVYRSGVGMNYSVNPIKTDLPLEDTYYLTPAWDGTNHYLYVTGLTFKLKVSIIRANPLTDYADYVSDGYYGISCFHKNRMFFGMPDNNIVTFSALGDFDNFDKFVQYQVVTNVLQMVNHDYVYLMTNNNNTALWDTYAWDEDTSQFVQGGTIPKSSLVIDTTTGLSVPDYSVIAGDFKITNSTGQLMALKSFDDKLVIMCEHSMHVMYGDTPDTSMQNQFQLVDVNNNLGCHSARCTAIGGGRLFWLGDDYEVYEYTGSALNIISRPGKTRNSTLAVGGISNIFLADNDVDFRKKAQMIATANKLYFNIGWASENKYLFVFDIYNRLWWCEDGEFTAIATYSTQINSILMALPNGDILRNYEKWNDDSVDYVFDFDSNKIVEKIIKYEFHTRVYGADGTDTRKTLDKVWFQARATASVYINDIWTSHDKWAELVGNEMGRDIDDNYRVIGTLSYDQQSIQPYGTDEKYRSDEYEQQPCYVEKMYGQRVNVFQIIVKGTGKSKFYLMKREWRAR